MEGFINSVLVFILKICSFTGIWVYAIVRFLIWFLCKVSVDINTFSNSERGITYIYIITKITLFYCAIKIVESVTQITRKDKFTFFSYFRNLFYDYRIYKYRKRKALEENQEMSFVENSNYDFKNKDKKFDFDSEIKDLFNESGNILNEEENNSNFLNFDSNSKVEYSYNKKIKNINCETDLDLSILGFDTKKENYTVEEIEEQLSELAKNGQTDKLLAYITKKKLDYAIKTGDYSSFKS